MRTPRCLCFCLLAGIALAGCRPRMEAIPAPAREAPPSGPLPVKVEGRALLVDTDRDGRYEPFLIKGVGYQPSPIGGGPAIPEDPHVIERDFELLRSMHCNTIRTWGSVHRMLLDCAEQYGIKVIAGFKPYEDTLELGDRANRADLIRAFRDYVAAFKDHPAILFWAIGNEDNYHYKGRDITDWYTLANEMAAAAKAVEGPSFHPVAIVNGDLHNVGDPARHADDASLREIDIWGMNVYIGRSFENSHLGNFFYTYAAQSLKPLWLSEYGIDAWDSVSNRVYEEQQADWVGHNWDEIARSGVCIGGTLMAYSDEWWKSGDPDAQDFGGYPIGSPGQIHPDGYSNEEWWGLVAVERTDGGVDLIHPRKVCDVLREKWGQPGDLAAKYAQPEPRVQIMEAARGRGITEVAASATKPGSLDPWAVVDGNLKTRWESPHGVDPVWIRMDLTEEKSLSGLRIHWETASAAEYAVEVSRDGQSWTRAITITNGKEGEKRIIRFPPVPGRFVRVVGTRRTTPYGYSIWEIEINP